MSFFDVYLVACWVFITGLIVRQSRRKGFRNPVGVAAMVLQFLLAPLFATIYFGVAFMMLFVETYE